MNIISAPNANKVIISSENAEQTITTIKLHELVSEARRVAGEKEVRSDAFMLRVEDELEGELGFPQNMENPEGGRPRKFYTLTLKQATLVAMRESKAVRRATVEKLEAMQQAVSQSALVPNFSNPAEAARAWALQYELAQEAKALADNATRTKAEIGSRREATAMATASIATRKAAELERELDRAKDYATVKRMGMLHHGIKFDWRKLRDTSAAMEIPAIDVFDQNYGTVKAYHSAVWMEAYAVSIHE